MEQESLHTDPARATAPEGWVLDELHTDATASFLPLAILFNTLIMAKPKTVVWEHVPDTSCNRCFHSLLRINPTTASCCTNCGVHALALGEFSIVTNIGGQ